MAGQAVGQFPSHSSAPSTTLLPQPLTDPSGDASVPASVGASGVPPSVPLSSVTPPSVTPPSVPSGTRVIIRLVDCRSLVCEPVAIVLWSASCNVTRNSSEPFLTEV